MSITPIFLLSLPRSGSTWAQRLLAGHPAVATVPEPWVLLPGIYALRHRGIAAEYDHQVLAQALEDFCHRLPGGRTTYYGEVRQMMLNLYGALASNGECYFLDKTPRYHLIVDEIFDLFPDARFIFLWRNPLAVVASMLSSWTDNKWHVHRVEVDLYGGLARLVDAYNAHGDTAYAMNYERLVADPRQSMASIGKYLGVDFDAATLGTVSDHLLESRLGDSTDQTSDLTAKRQNTKWAEAFTNPIRRRWAIRYLHWIGAERLDVMGYDLDRLLGELSSGPRDYRKMAPDLARSIAGRVFNHLQGPVVLRGLRRASDERDPYVLR